MENSKEVAEEDQTAPKPETPLKERILTALWLFPFLGIILYCVAWLFLSTPVNRVFHHPEQCTIVGAAKAESRSKSYSGNSFVYIKTTDCPGMRYKGDRNGLTLEEVADRIDRLEGQKVTVDVGSWQLPLPGDDVVVGVEGLDLSK